MTLILFLYQQVLFYIALGPYSDGDSYSTQKYRFPSRIDLKKCREEIASALNDFGNRWCKREYVEPNAL